MEVERKGKEMMEWGGMGKKGWDGGLEEDERKGWNRG
jgi:hypothetical protein